MQVGLSSTDAPVPPQIPSASLGAAPLAAERADLAARNLGFVTWVAREYKHCGVALEDLVAEGYLGLLEAARRFDAGRGIKFTTYAAWWIRKSILSALDAAPIVRRATHDAARPGTGPARMLSFDYRPADGSRETLGARLADTRTPDPEATVLGEEAERCVRAVIEALPPLERAVLEHRFGLDDRPSRSLRETGLVLGLCGERVRQIERRSLDRVRRALLRQGGVLTT